MVKVNSHGKPLCPVENIGYLNFRGEIAFLTEKPINALKFLLKEQGLRCGDKISGKELLKILQRKYGESFKTLIDVVRPLRQTGILEELDEKDGFSKVYRFTDVRKRAEEKHGSWLILGSGFDFPPEFFQKELK